MKLRKNDDLKVIYKVDVNQIILCFSSKNV